MAEQLKKHRQGWEDEEEAITRMRQESFVFIQNNVKRFQHYLIANSEEEKGKDSHKFTQDEHLKFGLENVGRNRSFCGVEVLITMCELYHCSVEVLLSNGSTIKFDESGEEHLQV